MTLHVVNATPASITISGGTRLGLRLLHRLVKISAICKQTVRYKQESLVL